MAIGRFARTIWELDPRQVVGRVGFRARRALWPLVRSTPSWPSQIPALPSRDALPSSCPFDDEDLHAIERGSLRLAGHEARLPDDAPFEPDAPDPLYRYQLHEHAWLREAMTRSSAARPSLHAWLLRYARMAAPRGSVAIDPYPLATRLLQWQGLVQLGLLDAGAMRAPIVEATRLLVGLSETHLLANHLLRDRAALVVGSAWIAGAMGEAVRARAARAFASECDAQFDPEGMHEERCPAYHAHASMDLLFALDAIAAGPLGDPAIGRAREVIARHAENAVAALEVVTHADDHVAAFGDSAPRSAPRTSEIAAWARSMGLLASRVVEHAAGAMRRRTLPRSGFSRVTGERMDVLLTHGPFGAPSQPGHAHCDLFAFELDVDGRRVIVDPGVHAYHDPTWRSHTRTSASHATPTVEGREQAEIWSRFRCGWRPRSIEARWTDDRVICEARAFGPHHATTLRRALQITPESLRLEDAIDDASEMSSALPLAPDLDAELEGARAVRVTRHGESVLSVQLLSEGRITIERAEVSHRFGARVPALRLRLHGPGRVEYTLVLAPP
ncbi:MAG: heparinase II/III family protein [Deltaproteobacteria bacterium]|nr:heparinase II/III family protein [Deltaproteobacteria bacterium]